MWEGKEQRAEDKGQIAAGRLQQAAFQLGTRHFFQRPVGKKSGAEAPHFFGKIYVFLRFFALSLL